MIASVLVVATVLHGAQSITSLSEKAQHLEIGMTRDHVIARLGPATWALLPTDTGDFSIPDASVSLVLIWKNPPCAPVLMDFDRDGTLIGMDEGRSVCGKDVELFKFEPPDSRSCARTDRNSDCR